MVMRFQSHLGYIMESFARALRACIRFITHVRNSEWELHIYDLPEINWPAILQCKKEGKDQELNQAPHLTQDTNGKVTTSQLDIRNDSQDVSPFPAGDQKESINRRARKHNKTKTEIT